MRQQAGELREDQRLVPFLDHFLQAAARACRAWRWIAGLLLVDQARMAGRLAQTQQGLEHLDLGAVHADRLDRLEQRLAVVLAQLVVELALFGLQLAVERLLGLSRAGPWRPAPWCGAG